VISIRAASPIGHRPVGKPVRAIRTPPAARTDETLDTKCGVYVISPQGKLLRFIPIPEDTITNTAFGATDSRSRSGQYGLLLTFQIQFGRLLLSVTIACDLTVQTVALERQDKPHRSLFPGHFEGDPVSHHLSICDFVALTFVRASRPCDRLAGMFEDYECRTRIAILWRQGSFPRACKVSSGQGKRVD
jgi:hypothetical protein